MVIIVSRWSEVISLTGITEGVDADGFPANVEVTRENIFANKLPVRSSEFYQASQAGYTVSALFKIRSVEYEGEESLIHEGNIYRIIRTFDKGEYVELSCEKQGVNHG